MKIIFSILNFLLVICIQAQDKKWSLEECVEYALKNNLTIKQSELNLEAAEIDKSDAVGRFLPSLNATASNFWNSGLSPDPLTGVNKKQVLRNSVYGLNAEVTLFSGLRNIREFQKAKLNKLYNQYNLEKSKDDILLLIANSYLQVLLNKESLKVIENQHKVTRKQLIRTKDLVDGGVLPQGELLVIQAALADESTRMIQAENAVKISLVGLAQTLLIKDYSSFDISDKEYRIPSSDILSKTVEDILPKAKESRYEIKIAEQNILLANKNLQISKTAYYPTLKGSFNINSRESGMKIPDLSQIQLDPDKPNKVIGFIESTGEDAVAPNYLIKQSNPLPFADQLSNNYGIRYGVLMTVPILNGFSIRNTVKRNKINIKQATFQKEKAELDIESDVYKAYLETKSAAKAYEASLAAVKAQEKAYEYARNRYDVGVSNSFDFSQSTQRLENAQSKEIQSRYDYIFKTKVLELYFGIKLINNLTVTVDLPIEKTIDTIPSAIADKIKETDDTSKTKKLVSKVKKMVVFTAVNVEAEGIHIDSHKNNYKMTPTTKANRTDKIRVCFTLSPDKLISIGEKELFVKVNNPAGILIGDKKTINYGNTELRYSGRNNVLYEGKSLDVCVLVNAKEGEIIQGVYTVKVFSESQMISENQFELK